MGKKKQKYTYKIRQKRLSRATYSLFRLFEDGGYFFALIGLLVGMAFFITGYPAYARWFGFLITAYGLIANDSIQTLGIFVTSNAHRTSWWVMWGFMVTIFFLTISFSWLTYGGDVSYGRLKAVGISSDNPVTFAQLLGPVILLLLTHWGVPVSTTFLLLSTFVKKESFVYAIVLKSITGYLLAFVLSFVLWGAGLCLLKQRRPEKPGKGWFFLQWVSSGLLWTVWLMQDGANASIFLPRSLDLSTFIKFAGCIGLLLGWLFYTGGGKIRRIVNTKTGITDVRAAVSVNLFYMLLLFAFTIWNKTPMSTTWMFIGLLGGREFASSIWLKRKSSHSKQSFWRGLYLVGRDLIYALLGLCISIGLSLFINPAMHPNIWM